MKKVIYVLILSLVAVSGLVLANREIKNEASKQPSPKPPTDAERRAAMKEWEASPAGIKYIKNGSCLPKEKKCMPELLK